MRRFKMKVILPLILLLVSISVQIPSTCYASTCYANTGYDTFTWKSFSQSFDSSRTCYTYSFNMNGGGMSVEPNASDYYGGHIYITLQQYNSTKWSDVSSKTIGNGGTSIWNGQYYGTFRFKIEYLNTLSSSTVKVDYASKQ